MNTLYETEISDARWIAYDIPGNVGWIIYIICICVNLKRGLHAFSILSVVPAIFMIVGIVELISERMARLDRVLPKKRLLRGFGVLTLGGLFGCVISVVGIIQKMNGHLPVWMLLGSCLCAVFAWLLFKGYHRTTNHI